MWTECDPHLSVVRQLIEVAPPPSQVAQLRWIEVAQCKITQSHLWHTCTVQDLQKSTTFVSGSHLIPHGFHPMRFYKQSAPTIWGNIRVFRYPFFYISAPSLLVYNSKETTKL